MAGTQFSASDPRASPHHPPPEAEGVIPMKYPRQQGEQALTVLTVDAGPPGGAGTGAGHGVTSRPLPTTAHVGTAGAKAAVWTGCQEEMGGWPLQAGSI